MGIYTKIIDLQKLGKAWDRVRKNRPACGVDQVTWEDFDMNCQENLKQLHLELSEKRYTPLPVKLVSIQQGEKIREVSLYTMRDKVVQHSIAEELNKIYQPLFSDSAYAYRPGKSALQAVESIHESICLKRNAAYMRGDISAFFDNILLEKLMNLLRTRIQEEDVLELIDALLHVESIGQEGILAPKKQGLYQGSVLAPVLSNIYLMDFDNKMQKECEFYVRYSDDFVVLCINPLEGEKIYDRVQQEFKQFGLKLNQEKSSTGMIAQGFDFLGYHFTSLGKGIPQKAEIHLTETLEEMWLTNADIPIEQRLKKGLEIETGWKQYYQEERQVNTILELAISVYGMKKFGIGDYDVLKKNRRKIHNVYSDVLSYLLEVWKSAGMTEMSLFEYEDYYECYHQENESRIAGRSELVIEMISVYEKLFARECRENYVELMQLYTDAGMYLTASNIAEKINRLPANILETASIQITSGQNTEAVVIQDTNQFMNLFAGREDMYSEEMEIHGHRKYETVLQPFTVHELRSHLAGERTLATYVQRSNATSHFLVVDIDISKKILLQCSDDSEKFREYYKKAGEMAVKLMETLKKMGLRGYLEESGYRGYHVWIFFQEWIAVRYINLLTDRLMATIKSDDDIIIDIIPNKTHLRQGNPGQAIKLPYGIHSKTGRRSRFLEDNFSVVEDINEYLHHIVTYSLNEVKRIINKSCQISSEKKAKGTLELPEEELQNLNTGIAAILTNCSLMRYLYCKAKSTGYLTHGERLSALYVFGHLGEDGKNFVHTIMEFTMNYQFHVTQRFIDRLPAKPISCTKLRDQYKQITAEYGCSCAFKRTKNCYPSPVLHAVKLSNEANLDVTVPSTHLLTREKEKKVREEMNIPANAQKLAQRILELKKQKRGIDKAISKVDRELKEIFDNAEVDCMEIEMGMLCRRNTEHGMEWYIEL